VLFRVVSWTGAFGTQTIHEFTRIHGNTAAKRNSISAKPVEKSTLVRRLIGMSTVGPSDIVYEIGPVHGIITAALATIRCATFSAYGFHGSMM
jgi:hypothetical protein